MCIWKVQGVSLSDSYLKHIIFKLSRLGLLILFVSVSIIVHKHIFIKL